MRRGVYVVGRPELARFGVWMAAVLACGPAAVLSHGSAAALWSIRDRRGRLIEVSVPARTYPRSPGIRVHRRTGLIEGVLTRHRAIPVTSPINEADAQDLVDPEALRAGLDQRKGRPGVRPLRAVLDRLTFALTDSELERLFLPIARRAGLSLPTTGTYVDGYKGRFLLA